MTQKKRTPLAKVEKRTVEKRTLIAKVENKQGVLYRVTSLFRRRNFNIESIAVGPSEDPDCSRMTIVVSEPEKIFGSVYLDQFRKQLEKLVDVRGVRDVTDKRTVARELALIKVGATVETRVEIMQIVEMFRARIVDVSPQFLVIEVTGDEDKINSLCANLEKARIPIKEVARTGRIALTRGFEEAWLLDKEKVKNKLQGMLGGLVRAYDRVQGQSIEERNYVSLNDYLIDLSEQYIRNKEEISIVAIEITEDASESASSEFASSEFASKVFSIFSKLDALQKKGHNLQTKAGKRAFENVLTPIVVLARECLRIIEASSVISYR